jgi:uncharacterized protein with HEPN domain
MNERDLDRLVDMLTAARKAQYFAAGRSRSSLDSDELLALALTRLLEIVGEAARSISPDTRAQIPHIQWPLIIGMRNYLAHDYLHVDYDVVWNTVEIDIPVLIEGSKNLLDQEGRRDAQ